MTELSKLRSAKNLIDLADLLGYEPKNLAYIAYQIPNKIKYHTFQIPKKSGGKRDILAPNEKVKKLQSRLSSLIYDCVDQTENKTERKPLSHGFERGQSIVTNAKKHVNQRYVFNVDLKDFFPSINFGRVRGFFIKNNSFELDPKVASLIAQIACFENELPQGSPCSPVISNLIGQSLDFYLVQLAKKHNCTYSRYADDITFSTKSRSFPSEIAQEKGGFLFSVSKVFLNKSEQDRWVAGRALVAQIAKSGFEINANKTRMQYRDSRQLTTGLVVNKKVNVKPEYYKTVRSQCHLLFNTGAFYHNKGFSKETGETITEPGSIAQLQGKLNFVYDIKNPNEPRRQITNDKHGKPYSRKWIKEQGPNYERVEQRKKGEVFSPRGIFALYQRFLHFKYLYSLDRPLVICEGKTDNIYLRCALNQLHTSFPDLAKIVRYTEKGRRKEKVQLSFDIFNNHGKIMELWRYGMGTSYLAKLIRDYERIFSFFKCDGMKHPVIIIVDNDDGPRGNNGVYKNIEKHGHEKVDGNKPFYFVTKNLYVIPLPKLQSGANREFEDLFYKNTLAMPYRGKIFAKQVKDKTKEFGKDPFAKYVVRANQSGINFRKFRPLIGVLEKVIDDYEKRVH